MGIAENGAKLWGTHPNQVAQPGHPGRVNARNYHAGTHIHGKETDKLIYKILRAAERKGENISNVLSEMTGRMESGEWKKHLNHVVENEYHS